MGRELPAKMQERIAELYPDHSYAEIRQKLQREFPELCQRRGYTISNDTIAKYGQRGNPDVDKQTPFDRSSTGEGGSAPSGADRESTGGRRQPSTGSDPSSTGERRQAPTDADPSASTGAESTWAPGEVTDDGGAASSEADVSVAPEEGYVAECSTCGQDIQILPRFYGSKVACPSCHTELLVPEEPPEGVGGS